MLALGGGGEDDALADLWQRGALCDVSLRAADAAAPLPCHRIVLAAASPFFRCVTALAAASRTVLTPACFAARSSLALPAGATPRRPRWSCTAWTRRRCARWLAPSTRAGWRHALAAGHARLLVAGRATRVCHVSFSPTRPAHAQVTPRTVAPLLAGATQLALPAACAAVAELLRCRLCPASALATSALAHAHGQRALAADADALCASQFAAVLREDPAGFAALPAERLAALLASDALAVASEADALRALLAWAAARHTREPAQREHEVSALLPLVRLRLIPRAALLEVRCCAAAARIGVHACMPDAQMYTVTALRRLLTRCVRHRSRIAGGG